MKKFFWQRGEKSEAEAVLGELLDSFDLGVSFFRNNIVRILLILGVFPLVATFIILGGAIFPTSIPLVLRYNVYFGVSLLGDWWQVYMVPIMGVFFYVVHVFLAERYYEVKERIVSYLILLASFFLGVAIFITALSLAIVNY
jgi:hypothetical protein